MTVRRFAAVIFAAALGGQSVQGQDPKAADPGAARPRLVAHLGQSYAIGDHRVAFGPDGKWVLLADWNTVRICDTESGRELRRFPHPDKVLAVAVSPDGKWLATGCNDRVARRWDVGTGRQTFRSDRHENGVTAIAISPDGRRWVGVGGGRASVRETATNREISGFPVWGLSAAFSPDGKRIAVGEFGRDVRIWAADTGDVVRLLQKAPEDVERLAFSPDGTLLVGAQASGPAVVWDVRAERVLRRLDPEESVTDAFFTPDGKHIVTVAYEGVDFWALPNFVRERRFALKHRDLRAAALGPDGRRLRTAVHSLASGWPGHIDGRLTDLETGKDVRTFAGQSSHATEAVAFSPDGVRLLVGGKNLRIWEGRTGRRSVRADLNRPAVFAPDGRAAVARAGEEAHFLDAETGRTIRTIAIPKFTEAFAVSPDGALLATGGEEIRRFGSANLSGRCVMGLSRDGTRVLAGTESHARIFDTDSGKEIAAVAAYPETFRCFALSPDGKRMLTGGQDGTARLWDAETGRELCRLISFADGTWAVTDPEGRYDGSDNGRVPWLHWVVDGRPVDLDRFRDRFFEPGCWPSTWASTPGPCGR